MPSLEELENSIIEQCSEPDGILSLIRENQFDEAKYLKLIEPLAAYRDALGNLIWMSRKLAGWLRAIDNAFLVAVTAYNKEPRTSEFDRRLTDAHPQILDLMYGIFGVTCEYENIALESNPFVKFHDTSANCLANEDSIARLERLNYQIIARSKEDDEIERGMITLLRDLTFNDEKYRDLINQLEGYLEALGQVKWINRQVAAYQLMIDSQFLGAFILYDRDKWRKMDDRIKAGYPKFATLMDRIFDVTLDI